MVSRRSLPTYAARCPRSRCMSGSATPCADSGVDASNASRQDHWETGRRSSVGNTLQSGRRVSVFGVRGSILGLVICD